jgi:surface antigen
MIRRISTKLSTGRRALSLLLGLAALVALLSPASCLAAATGDDYPSKWRDIPMDSVFDDWGMYNRECTSAVAWWLHERNGFDMPFYDNASGWGSKASARGFAVNGTPAVGAVAWWGPGNHVAWVEAVGAGSVKIEEYNYDFAGHYHERTIPSSAPSGYIHFKDIPNGPPGEGSFVSHNGFVYRIAGGAPIYVSNWTSVGGPQQARTLSDTEFAALPQFPRDGTLLGASDGGVYIAAGGAPLYLSNWAAIGGPKPSIGIDGAAVSHAGDGVPWDHLRSYPADGTLLGASDGRVYIAAGGAPLWLSNWAAIGGPKPSVAIDRWDVENTADPHAHLRLYPADGTFIRSTGTGRVYRVAGGAPIYVSTWNIFGGVQPFANIDQWAFDHPADPHAHLRAAPLDGTVVKGLPSNQHWIFGSEMRSPIASLGGAVAVDDVGLNAFGIRPAPASAASTAPQSLPSHRRKRCRSGTRSRRCKHRRHRHRRGHRRAAVGSTDSSS